MKRRIISVEAKASTMMAVFDFLDMNGIEAKSMSGAINAFLQFQITLYQTAGKLPVYDCEEDCELLLADRVQLVGKMQRAKQTLLPSQTETVPASAQRGRESLREHIHREAVTDADFAPMSFNSGFEQKLQGEAGLQCQSQIGLQEEINSELDLILARAKTLPVEDLYPSQAGTSADELDTLLHREIAAIERQDEENLLAKITVGTVANSSTLPKVNKQMQMISDRDPRLSKDKLWKAFTAEGDAVKQTALRIVYFHLAEEFWSSEKAEQLLQSIILNLNKEG